VFENDEPIPTGLKRHFAGPEHRGFWLITDVFVGVVISLVECKLALNHVAVLCQTLLLLWDTSTMISPVTLNCVYHSDVWSVHVGESFFRMSCILTALI